MAKVIINRTLFECPFPAVSVISNWITDASENVLKMAGKAYEMCDEVCRREVSKSPSHDSQMLMKTSYAVGTGVFDLSWSTVASRTLSTFSKSIKRTQLRSKVE